MNPKGNVWAGFGKRDSGKSFEQLALAEMFRTRTKSPKRTIIYDWTQNDATYGHIQLIDIEDLNYKLPVRALVKVQNRDTDLFLTKCQLLHNACIIIDDATAKFKGIIPRPLEELLYKAKNQRLEIMFQFHTIRASAPALLDACNMFLIKATTDAMPIKSTAPFPEVIEKIILDCRAENRNYDEKKNWATRIFDVGSETVWIKDITEPNFIKSYKNKTSVEKYLGIT
jgi:hypothetical protein